MFRVICKGLKKFNEWTANCFKSAVDEHKWYLSEKEFQDVGLRKAEMDFLRRHVEHCAAGWRVEYCSAICEQREDCELGKKFIERDGQPSKLGTPQA